MRAHTRMTRGRTVVLKRAGNLLAAYPAWMEMMKCSNASPMKA